jgi:hypothetical protein
MGGRPGLTSRPVGSRLQRSSTPSSRDNSQLVEAEVDFGDVPVPLAGELVACSLFSLRLSYSGKAVHRICACGGQETRPVPRSRP